MVSILSQPSPNLNTIRQLTSQSWPTLKNILSHVHGNAANLRLPHRDGRRTATENNLIVGDLLGAPRLET